jgi:hypothetical protein
MISAPDQMLDSLPSEIIILILDHLSSHDLGRVNQVSRYFHMISQDWDVWATQAAHDFGCSRELFKLTQLPSPLRRYQEVQTYRQIRDEYLYEVDPMTYIYIEGQILTPRPTRRVDADMTMALETAIEHDDLTTVERVLQLLTASAITNKVRILNGALPKAVKRGDWAIIEDLLIAGATARNDAMILAAKLGNWPLTKLLYDNGATDVNDSLRQAAYMGQLIVVRELLKIKGVDPNSGFQAAICQNHLAVVQELLRAGARNLDEALYLAKFFEHREMIKIIKEAQTQAQAQAQGDEPTPSWTKRLSKLFK